MLKTVAKKIAGRLNRRLTFALHKRIINMQFDRSIVSFTFDDFPRTTCENGAPILKENGVLGTFYACFGKTGSQDNGDIGPYFTEQHVRELTEDGHEVACHSCDHLLCSHVTCNEYLQNIQKNKELAGDLITGLKLENFAFPAGSVTPAHKKELSQHYQTLRSTYPGINHDSVDLNLILANPLYSNRYDLSHFEELILRNNQLKGWLVFYTHDVCPKPSNYGCTPECLGYLVEVAKKTGARLFNIKEVVSYLQESSFK